MCPVNRRRLGIAKLVDMQNLSTQEASKSGKFVTKKVGTNVNPADLMTEPLPRPKSEQLMKLMVYQFVENGQVKPKTESNVVSAETSRTLNKCVEAQARGATSERRAGWCGDRQYNTRAVE